MLTLGVPLGVPFLRLRHTHEPEPDNAGVGKRKLGNMIYIFVFFSFLWFEVSELILRVRK